LNRGISLSSLKGGEGRGEEDNIRANIIPLTPALSPLGRGEGAAARAAGNILANPQGRK